MARIYLSSTYADLQEHRAAVYHALRRLRHDVVAMEDYVAADRRPVDKCLRDIAECDIYVGIIALRYGYVPTDDNPDRKSITELEFRHATRLGRPRLLFLLDKNAPWQVDLTDWGDEAAERGQRIERFRTELERSCTVSCFSGLDELAGQVAAAVQLHLADGEAPAMLRVNPDLVRARFVDHMTRFAGATSRAQALARYLPLQLQESSYISRPGYAALPTGAWCDLIRYPSNLLLLGEPGSGKTTELLEEAVRLLEPHAPTPAGPLPLYLSASSFRAGDADTILEMGASANAVSYDALRSGWREGSAPLCLMIDDVAAGTQDDAVIGAIHQLREQKAASNSLIVACQPGTVRAALQGRDVDFRELLVLPLDLDAATQFLTRYGRPDLAELVGHRLLETLERPDVLSALAQSVRRSGNERLPNSVGRIFDLYLEHLAGSPVTRYDYRRVKAPLLGKLAHRLALSRQPSLVRDDALYDDVITTLDAIHRRHLRRHRIMPADWTADELIDEVVASGILEIEHGEGDALRFARTRFLDFYVAVELLSMSGTPGAVAGFVAAVGAADAANALIMLAGLDPDTNALLDGIAAVDTGLAAEVWFESRIPRVQPPQFVEREFQRRRKEMLARLPAVNQTRPFGSPAAEGLRRLNPRDRFGALERLAGSADPDIASLVDFAADAHPLVAGAAEYMLVHLGEDLLSEESAFPNLPLKVAGDELLFASVGGGHARIGDLNLLQVPVPSWVELAVHVGRIPRDVFSLDAHLRFSHVPPSLLAASYFGSGHRTDWLGFCALCHCIASTASDLAAAIDGRDALQDLQAGLLKKSVEYHEIGRMLAEDMAILWPPIESWRPPVPPRDFEHEYLLLRRTFGAANRSRLQLLSPAADAAINASVSAQDVEGSTWAVLVKGTVYLLAADERPSAARILASSSARQVRRGTVGCIDLGTLNGVSAYLPTLLSIDCSLTVDRAEHATVAGLVVRRLLGAHPGWHVRCSISVGWLEDSYLEGVVVEAHEPVPGDPQQPDAPNALHP
jgi:hypothetical protein